MTLCSSEERCAVNGAVGAEQPEIRLELARLAPRLVVEDGLRDAEHARLCIEEYQRFLTLAHVHRGVALTPSSHVEAVWSRHLLDTKVYFTDCEAACGAYAHRVEHAQDAAVQGIDSCVFGGGHASFATTCKLYAARYGAAPCTQAWAEPGQASLRFLPEHDSRVGAAACVHAVTEVLWGRVTGRSEKDKRKSGERRAPSGFSHVLLSNVDLSWVGEAVAAELPLKQRACKNFAPLAKVAVEDTEATVEEYRRFIQMM